MLYSPYFIFKILILSYWNDSTTHDGQSHIVYKSFYGYIWPICYSGGKKCSREEGDHTPVLSFCCPCQSVWDQVHLVILSVGFFCSNVQESRFRSCKLHALRIGLCRLRIQITMYPADHGVHCHAKTWLLYWTVQVGVRGLHHVFKILHLCL